MKKNCYNYIEMIREAISSMQDKRIYKGCKDGSYNIVCRHFEEIIATLKKTLENVNWELKIEVNGLVENYNGLGYNEELDSLIKQDKRMKVLCFKA